MRDPERISEVLRKLEMFWRSYPDLRLGQLICNLTSTQREGFYIDHLFNMEEDEFNKRLDSFIERYGISPDDCEVCHEDTTKKRSPVDCGSPGPHCPYFSMSAPSYDDEEDDFWADEPADPLDDLQEAAQQMLNVNEGNRAKQDEIETVLSACLTLMSRLHEAEEVDEDNRLQIKLYAHSHRAIYGVYSDALLDMCKAINKTEKK
jgi:hypothetical protein